MVTKPFHSQCPLTSSTKMLTKVIVFLSVVGTAFCNDLHSGFSDSRERVIFEQTYDYKPNVYVRRETVNVSANGDDVINKIEVIDKRELKDGESTIISGGIGQKSVSILLQGPAVFRGMTFVVKVWAVAAGNLGNAANMYYGQRNAGQNAGDYYAGRSENFEVQRNVDLNAGLRAGTGLKSNGRYENYETRRNEEFNTGVRTGTGLKADGRYEDYENQRNEDSNTGLRAGTGLRSKGRYGNYENRRNEDVDTGLRSGTGLKSDGRYENYETQRNEDLQSDLQPGTGLRTDGTSDGVSVSYGFERGQSRNGQYNYGTKTGSYVYDRQGQELSDRYTKQ